MSIYAMNCFYEKVGVTLARARVGGDFRTHYALRVGAIRTCRRDVYCALYAVL